MMTTGKKVQSDLLSEIFMANTQDLSFASWP